MITLQVQDGDDRLDATTRMDRIIAAASLGLHTDADAAEFWQLAEAVRLYDLEESEEEEELELNYPD